MSTVITNVALFLEWVCTAELRKKKLKQKKGACFTRNNKNKKENKTQILCIQIISIQINATQQHTQCFPTLFRVRYIICLVGIAKTRIQITQCKRSSFNNPENGVWRLGRELCKKKKKIKTHKMA